MAKTTAWFQEKLRELIESDSDANDENVSRVESFEEAGVLTRDCGLVVKMDDGSVFQVTIVKA